MKKGAEYLASTTKRSLDLLGGFTIAAALLPPAVSAAAWADVSSRQLNPLFKQERVGQAGKHFMLMKLRTLHPQEVERVEADSTTIYGAAHPAASSFGKIIRRSGLDETPQLISILKGDMSLVGIRPVPERELAILEDFDGALFGEWFAAYRAGKPGLVGPGQLYRRPYAVHDSQVYCEAMKADLQYHDHASLDQDLKLLGSVPLCLLVSALRPTMNSPALAPQAEAELSPSPALPPTS